MITRHTKPIVHTEYSIQKLLIHRFMNGACYLVPNLYYRLGEMDLFLLRRSGYAEEFEIKLSTSDLKADAKKLGKHAWLLSTFNEGTSRKTCHREGTSKKTCPTFLKRQAANLSYICLSRSRKSEAMSSTGVPKPKDKRYVPSGSMTKIRAV